jgi:hypothetical protein
MSQVSFPQFYYVSLASNINNCFRFDETFKNEEGSEEVLVTAKDFLLQGLADENKEIRYCLTNLLIITF